MLMGIGGLVPLPSDALVSPVTFRVKQRNLRGLLAEFDAKSPATVSFRANGLSAARPGNECRQNGKLQTSRAYYLSSAAAQRIISIPLAKYTDSRVFALDYRLAPETCFPGPLHDAVSAYFRLVEDLHIPPENIIVAGDSAGGGLSLALLMYLRDNGYALPSSAILMSPWVDLTMSCESWDSNAPYDVVPFPTADNHMNPIALYLGENTEQYLTHPYASPLFGDFKGLPPLLVQAGDAEVLRDEITLLAHKATLAGVQVVHELYEDAIHVFQAYPFLGASRRSFESMRTFVRETLPKYQSRSPQLLAVIAERGMEQEIETDRSVFVGGDGVEEKVQEFGKETKSAAEMGNMDDAEPDLVDDGSSWVRSPMTSMAKRPGTKNTRNKNSQADDANLEHIPHLHLSPPLASPIPHHAFQSQGSPSPVSPSRSTSPRRIQSTSCLSLFESIKPNNPLDSTLRVHSPQNQHTSQKRNVTFLVTAQSPSMQHARSRSTTFLSPPSNLTVTSINPPRHSPSLRKKVSGLMIKSKQIHAHAPMPLSMSDTLSASNSLAGPTDIKALVNDWTRLGPANQTVVNTAP
ncbi:Alpha/Beta hydrolase protein [Gymnopilus junonius]|uniref:Alpha/Beta hydrolase protein n=1 Tax=Gymnopilus junonius TaxID=109634 RepID=A0A9P5NYX6_GYMJU|nr:Alpha/Beta hydrolase protein [Gymnopilus junonius]